MNLTVEHMTKNTFKGSSVGGYRNLLLQKYENYRKTTKKKLITASYTLPYKNNYTDPCFYVHWKILSENLKKQSIWYDVVIQFNTEDRIRLDTRIRVFCNSHQFTYTYAYCFNKYGLLLFEHLYPKIVLTEFPKIKNPYCMLGMDKHVYVALKETIKKRITYDTVSSLGKTEWSKDLISFNTMNNLVLKATKKLKH